MWWIFFLGFKKHPQKCNVDKNPDQTPFQCTYEAQNLCCITLLRFQNIRLFLPTLQRIQRGISLVTTYQENTKPWIYAPCIHPQCMSEYHHHPLHVCTRTEDIGKNYMWFSKQFISLLQWRKKVPHKHVASLYQSHTPQMHARKRNLSMHCPCQSFNWSKHIKSSCERCKMGKSLGEQIRVSRSARQRAGMTGSELRIDPVQFWYVKWPKVLYNKYLFFIKGFMSTYCKLTIKRWENVDDKSKWTWSSSSNLGITQVLTNLMIVALSIWPTPYNVALQKFSNIALQMLRWRCHVETMMSNVTFTNIELSILCPYY